MQPVNYYSATLVHPSPYLSSVVAVPAMQMNRNSMNSSNKYAHNAVDVAAQMLTLQSLGRHGVCGRVPDECTCHLRQRVAPPVDHPGCSGQVVGLTSLVQKCLALSQVGARL